MNVKNLATVGDKLVLLCIKLHLISILYERSAIRRAVRMMCT